VTARNVDKTEYFLFLRMEKRREIARVIQLTKRWGALYLHIFFLSYVIEVYSKVTKIDYVTRKTYQTSCTHELNELS
jgi:hypothetical protein